MKLVQHWLPWQQVLGLWILSVIYFFGMGWAGVTLLPELIGWGLGIPEQISLNLPNPSHWFTRWDSGYYLKIAEHGYAPNGTERAFYPLYPLLARGLSAALGLSLTLAGLLISVIAFAGATFTLYAWVRLDHTHSIALTATALLCLSPVSYYFIAFYPESLFMGLSLLSLYCLRRGWFLASGIIIAITGPPAPRPFSWAWSISPKCFNNAPILHGLGCWPLQAL